MNIHTRFKARSIGSSCRQQLAQLGCSWTTPPKLYAMDIEINESGQTKRFHTRSLEEKYNIITSREMGESVSRICERFQIKVSAYYSLQRRASYIKAAYLNGEIKSSAKRVRLTKFEDVDQGLLAFLRTCLDNRIPISGDMLVLKARQIAEEIGHEYKPDINWVQRWKKRHGIVQKSFQGEAASADTEAANDFLRTTLPMILSRYKPADIWNADETGLFFRCLPGKTHTFKDLRCVGGKNSKERVTVLLAASMEGEKLPPLVIGKAANPRCFKGIWVFPDVVYKAHPKAWMSQDLFREWLYGVDRMMIEKGRTILMFIDNCAAHPQVEGLQAVEIMFLPPNTTSRIQPLDAGIIRTMKAHYRKELAKRHLIAFENGKNTQVRKIFEEDTEIRHLQISVSIFMALRLLESAWNRVSPVTIRNCYCHAGFSVAPENMEEDVPDEDDDDDDEFNEWEALIQSGAATETFTQYNDVDSSTATRSEEISEAHDGGIDDQAPNGDLPGNLPTRQSKEYKVLEKIWEIQKILRSDARFAEEVTIADKLEEKMLRIRHRPSS